ncbi:MAG: flagellar protein FliT [Gammaproteobacteria bacterium]
MANQADIARLRALTQALLGSAESGDWDAVARVEGERRGLLYAVFGTDGSGAQAGRQALLNEILSADRQIVRLAQQHRDELGGLLRQVGHGRTVLKAYDDNRR